MKPPRPRTCVIGVRYDIRAEDRMNGGGSGGLRPEPGVRCRTCGVLNGLHVESVEFACEHHCGCERGLYANT